MEAKSVPEKVRAALEGAEDFMSVDQIARAAFGRSNDRNRAAVYMAVHRMEGIETRAKGYRLKQQPGRAR